MKLFNLNNIEKDFFNRASGTSETKNQGVLTFVSFKSQKTRKKKKIRGRKKILEKIMTENFPYLAKDKNLQIQGSLRTPNGKNTKNP